MAGEKKMMGLLCMFFMVLLSYGPLATEIDDLATNATTTNAVVLFLDSWFGLFWALMGFFILAIFVWVAISNVR